MAVGGSSLVFCFGQELRGVSLDCDSDALRFTVRQHGDPAAFCHFNRFDSSFSIISFLVSSPARVRW